MRSALLLPVTLALASCASVQNAPEEEIRLSYGCDDLVVIARQALLSEELVPSNHPIGVSRMVLRIDIKSVVRGSEPRRSVLAEGTLHNQPREDLDFLLVLRPRPDGTYLKSSGAVWDATPPKLAEPCSSTPS